MKTVGGQTITGTPKFTAGDKVEVKTIYGDTVITTVKLMFWDRRAGFSYTVNPAPGHGVFDTAGKHSERSLRAV